jgi:hypothetical protein
MRGLKLRFADFQMGDCGVQILEIFFYSKMIDLLVTNVLKEIFYCE